MTHEQPKPHDPGKKTNDDDTILDEVEESLPTDPQPTDGPAPAS
jgi:hypothetical protein